MNVSCCELYSDPTERDAAVHRDLAGLEVLSRRCYRRPDSCHDDTPRPVSFQLGHIDLGCCELCAGRVVDEMQRLGGPAAFLQQVAEAWSEREERRRGYRLRLAEMARARRRYLRHQEERYAALAAKAETEADEVATAVAEDQDQKGDTP